MNVHGWWSRTGQVLICMDVEAARRLETVIAGRGRDADLVEIRLRDEIRVALVGAPAGT